MNFEETLKKKRSHSRAVSLVVFCWRVYICMYAFCLVCLYAFSAIPTHAVDDICKYIPGYTAARVMLVNVPGERYGILGEKRGMPGMRKTDHDPDLICRS